MPGHTADDDRERPPSAAGSSSEATIVPWKSWSLSMDQDIDGQDPSLLTVNTKANRLVSVRLSDTSSLGAPHIPEERTRTTSGKSMATTATSRSSWQTQSSDWHREERSKLDDVLHFAPVEFDSHLKLPSSWNPKRGSRASKASKASNASKMSKLSKLSRATDNSFDSRSPSPAFMTAEDFGNGSSIHRRNQSGSSYFSNRTGRTTNTQHSQHYTDARPHSPDSEYQDDLGSYRSKSESTHAVTEQEGVTEECEHEGLPGEHEHKGVTEDYEHQGVAEAHERSGVPEEYGHEGVMEDEIEKEPAYSTPMGEEPSPYPEEEWAAPPPEEPPAPYTEVERLSPPPEEPPLEYSKEDDLEDAGVKAIALRRESTTRSVLERLALQHLLTNKALPPRPSSMPGRPQSSRPRPKSMALSRRSTKSFSKSEKSLRSNVYPQPSIASVTKTFSQYRPRAQQKVVDHYSWDEGEVDSTHVDLSPARFWIVFIAMNLNIAMFTLDQFLVTIAAPRIAAYFKALDRIAWLNIAFFIPCAAALLLYTQVMSIFPPRYVYVVALVVFLVGNAVSGSAASMTALLVGRAISALGGAGIWNTTFLIATDIVPAYYRSRVFDIFGLSYIFASVLGPLIGGGLTDLGASWGWRWCFYIYLPICGATFLVLAVFLPSTPLTAPFDGKQDKRPQWKRALTIDYLSFVLTLVFLICLCFALQWGGVTRPWSDPNIITALVFSGVLFCALVGWNWYRGSRAMIPLSLFRSIHFNGAIWVAFFGYSLVTVILFYLSVYFQSVLGTSATRAGVLMLGIQCAVSPMLILAGKFGERTGHAKVPIVVGCILVAITTGIMSTYTSTTSLATVVGIEILAGVGLGLILNLIVVLMQAKYHRKAHLIPYATNVFNFWGFVGRVVGLALATTIFENKLHRTVDRSPLLDVTKASLLSSPLAMWDNRLLGLQNRQFIQEMYATAIHNVWWLCLAMALACGYAAMAMRNLKLTDIIHEHHSTGTTASSGDSIYTSARESLVPFEKEDARSLIRYSAPPSSYKLNRPVSLPLSRPVSVQLSRPASQRLSKPASERSSAQNSSVQRSSMQRSSVQRSSYQRSSYQRSSAQGSSIQRSSMRSSAHRSSQRSAPRNASPPPPVPPLPDMASLTPASAETPRSIRSTLPWGQQASTPRASPAPPSPVPPYPIPPLPSAPSPISPLPGPVSSYASSLPSPPLPHAAPSPHASSPLASSPIRPPRDAPPSAPSSPESYPFPDFPEPAYLTRVMSSTEAEMETASAADSSMALPDLRSFTPLDPELILSAAPETPPDESTEKLRFSGRQFRPSPKESEENLSLDHVESFNLDQVVERPSLERSSGRPSLEGRALPPVPTPTPPPASSTASLPSPTVAGPRASPSRGRTVGGPRPIGGPRPLPKGPAPKTPLPPTPVQRWPAEGQPKPTSRFNMI